MNAVISTSIFCLLLLSASLQAEVFKYRDDQGRTHYVSSESAIPERYRGQSAPAELPAVNRLEFLDQRDIPSVAKQEKVANPRIEIFVTSWCGHCTRLENYLRQKKVDFVRYDIEESFFGKQKYDSMGGRGVPLVKIGSQVLRGFNAREIDRALGGR